MARRAKCQTCFLPDDDLGEQIESYGRILALRILARGGAKIVASVSHGEPEDIIAVLGEADCPEVGKIAPLAASYLAELEKLEIVKPQILYGNLDLLARAAPLSANEKDLIGMDVIINNYRPLCDIVNGCGDLSDHGLTQLISIALEMDREAAGRILAANGVLRSSGLVNIARDVECYRMKLRSLEGLCNALLSRHKNLDSLLSMFIRKSPPAAHQLNDFENVKDVVRTLLPYLRNARKACTKGCNILLYGPSGVGKTEAVRAIARELDFALYEIEFEDNEGDPMQGCERLRHYRFAQHLLANKKNAVILFDEVEDIFPAERPFLPFFAGEQGSGKNKAWTNRILEENSTPAFWVANRVEQVDPAFLRRFDFVVEMKPLPRSARHRLFLKCFDGLPVSDKWVARLAENPNLTPADIARARKVLALADTADCIGLENQIELVLKGHLAAQGMRNNVAAYPKPDEFYDDIFNTSMDTACLAECLAKNPRARACLYGPPGTGKTLLAHHLADLMGKPILVRRASDILSMWVGGTERNLAGIFEEARAEEAILLLDEVDSFLQDRRDACHHWEVTQVNELLTQMECFPGIFICATNFMESLDSAVLRRFPIKIAFDYLTRDQREKCFTRTLRAGGCPADGELPEHVRASLARLDNLTPGNFAAIGERWRILTVPPTPDLLLRELQEESRLKPAGLKSSIGFAPGNAQQPSRSRFSATREET